MHLSVLLGHLRTYFPMLSYTSTGKIRALSYT